MSTRSDGDSFAPDLGEVLQTARMLQQIDRQGPPQAFLRGRHFALLCEQEDHADARLFRQAASALGAHTAFIRLSQCGLDNEPQLRRTAQLLGRLYDAVECQGVDGPLVSRLAREAGIPAFAGLATATHPTIGLIDQLPADLPRRAPRGRGRGAPLRRGVAG